MITNFLKSYLLPPPHPHRLTLRVQVIHQQRRRRRRRMRSVGTLNKMYQRPSKQCKKAEKVAIEGSKVSYMSARFLSPKLKVTLGIDDSNYVPANMYLVVSNLGDLGEKEFHHISCQVCTKDFIPLVISRYQVKLPDNPTFVDLLNNWDILKISPTLMDLSVCFSTVRHISMLGLMADGSSSRLIEHTLLHTKIKAVISEKSVVLLSNNHQHLHLRRPLQLVW